MSDSSTRKTEIALTKELAKRLRLKYPTFRIYDNRCPSRSSIIRAKWKDFFNQTCPPLQPEMDLIIWDPLERKVRAVEIKWFTKNKNSINQPFYKGIEQSLALLQWGFDNVALWQFFDETLSMEEIRVYGCKTWQYIHGLLHLPIEFTPFRIIGSEINKIHFNVIQADWKNNLQPIPLLDIDDKGFKITWKHDNPFLNLQPFQIEHIQMSEITFLRKTLLEWLEDKELLTN